MVTEIWSNQIDSILGSGRSLEDAGVRNWALNRVDALNALQQLLDAGIAVSGGDVYKLVGDTLESTYDNWYCDKEAGESAPHYVERSVIVAKSYIAAYPTQDVDVYFALVPSLR